MTSTRFDIYAPIHKAFRLLMAESLVAIGRVDEADQPALEQALADLGRLLAFCRLHIEDEERFIHDAIAARRPGAPPPTLADHRHHAGEIAALEAEVGDLLDAPREERAGLLHALYRRLAVFIGENLVHMESEERDNNALLRALFSEAEIVAIHDRILEALPPEARLAGFALVVRASRPSERAALLGELRQSLPPPAFAAILEAASQGLSPLDRQKLAVALERQRLAA